MPFLDRGTWRWLVSLEGLLAVVDPVAVAYDGGGTSGVLMMLVALGRDGKVCRRVSQCRLREI